MKLAALNTVLALLALKTSAAVPGSCKSGVIDIALVGDGPGAGQYPNYTLSVPEDGRTVPITNSLVVYSITPPYYPAICPTNCTFIGAEGVISYYQGFTIDVDGPQAQLSVSCTTADPAQALCISATSLSPSELYSCTVTADDYISRPHFTSLPSASSTSSGAAPPYPITTGSTTAVGTVGTVGPSASASLNPIATGRPLGSNGTVVSFAGDAGRFAGSIGSSLLAFIGLFAAF